MRNEKTVDDVVDDCDKGDEEAEMLNFSDEE